MAAATPLTIRPNHGRDLIVYIDGFNLYHGLHDASGRSKLWLDVVAQGVPDRVLRAAVVEREARVGRVGRAEAGHGACLPE